MCAAHVGAALRLRRALLPDSFEGAEAVLDPNGVVSHAEEPAKTPGARDALREAVLSSERARGSMRRTDPVDALELWQALVAGRWSLIGYELGLAPSTVSKHLASAMRKLGVRTHAELMQTVSAKSA
jgi:FixJ family two-component response regulator